MSRGDLGGLNYRMTFPGQSGQVQPVAQQQGQVPEEEGYGYQLPSKLATRRAKLNSLNEKYGLLKSIVTELEKSGERWDRPDFSQEGGGLAYQTYLAAEANVRYAAQELANEQAAEEDLRQSEAEGKIRFNSDIDPTEDLAYSDPRSHYSTALDPRTVAANQRTAQNVYTQRDANNINTAVYNPAIQDVKDTYSGEEEQYQLGGPQPSVAETPYQSLVQDQKNDAKGSQYGYQVALLRKYTNLKNGVWPTGTYGKTTIDGKVYLKNEDGKGDTLGKYEAGLDKNGNPILKDKIVDSWIKDPSTGKVFVKYTDPNLDLEEVSNTPGDAVTRSFVSNNSKYGSVDKIMEAATALGITDETGSSQDNMLMPDNYQDIQNKARQSGTVSDAAVAQKTNSIKKELKDLPTSIWGNDWKEYTLPDGKSMKIARHQGKQKFYIKNAEELGITGDTENLSSDEIISTLSDLRYFDKFTTDIDPDI